MEHSKHIAVVTGAASGIGKSTVERLLAHGWSVCALDISEDALASHAAELQVGDRYWHHKCDVSSHDSIKLSFAAIRRRTDKVDALVCSAGIVRPGSLEEQSVEDVDRMLAVNLKGPWLTTKEALPMLRNRSDVDHPSRVVFLGSIAGIRPKVGGGFYGASKAALHVITGVLAVELAASGVLVNAVAPGTVATPMVEAMSKPGTGYQVSGESPLGRIAAPDDIVDVIMFFLSDAARYVNGTVLPVDGGTRAAFVRP
ncbi:SDR family oxidoreductase [Variovorax paradoxus]|nr:SDR family oxidoreductase [Variovorax paradoxus]MBT2305446.1 SDR family oxidoreductase [Variovorax paradoxus]